MGGSVTKLNNTLDSRPELSCSCAMSNCAYCNNVYSDPRILNCLHSFCKKCITQLQQDEETTSIVCPACNESNPLPEGGVSYLPTNIRLREKAEEDKIKQKVTTDVPVPCDSCEDDQAGSSIAYCNDCQDFLCEECWKAHQKVRSCRSHSSILLKESAISKVDMPVNKVDTPMSSSDNDTKCIDHTLPLKYYCTQCSIPVCAECSVTAHNGHPVCELSNQAEKSKLALRNITEKLKVYGQCLETTIPAIDKRKQVVESQTSKVENKIKQAFAKLYELIRKREEALLQECNEIAIAKETRLTLHQERIQELLACLNLWCSLSSIATNEYTDVQLLSIARTLLNRATSLQEQFTNTPTDVCETACITAEVNTDSLIAMVAEVGSVVDSSPSSNNTTVIIPRTKLGIGAEMKVTVVSRDRSGKWLDEGGSIVRCSLRYNGGKCVECCVNDNDDGTYTVTIQSKILGQHQLSITINGQVIQGSPFRLEVVPQGDYRNVNDPVQVVNDAGSPRYIAFSDDGNMFVTDSGSCIRVYDRTGQWQTTIGSKGDGELQFNVPRGLAIGGDVIYVAENKGQRIHKLTTGGEFLGTYGKKGTSAGKLTDPYAIGISPDGKMYVSDCRNRGSRVQAFNPDWSLSHVIDIGGGPEGLAFDLSGNVHVACSSNSVSVFSPNGDLIRQYDHKHLSDPTDIAIDSSGYSIVLNYGSGLLSIFDPKGQFIRSIGEHTNPWSVAISPTDGSIWLSGDTKLVKY